MIVLETHADFQIFSFLFLFGITIFRMVLYLMIIKCKVKTVGFMYEVKLSYHREVVIQKRSPYFIDIHALLAKC